MVIKALRIVFGSSRSQVLYRPLILRSLLVSSSSMVSAVDTTDEITSLVVFLVALSPDDTTMTSALLASATTDETTSATSPMPTLEKDELIALTELPVPVLDMDELSLMRAY